MIATHASNVNKKDPVNNFQWALRRCTGQHGIAAARLRNLDTPQWFFRGSGCGDPGVPVTPERLLSAHCRYGKYAWKSLRIWQAGEGLPMQASTGHEGSGVLLNQR